MADQAIGADPASKIQDESDLKRSITGKLLFFYVLGDVLGSGIYVLIGSVAGAVGGAFWVAFGLGVTVATITGLAYAELVTKYPQAAGAALYVNKAFGKRPLTFLITFCMLSASFAAAASLAQGFSDYFSQVWSLPPALLIGLLFIVALAVVNFIGITESVVANVVMTVVEVSGLVIILACGVIFVSEGKANFHSLVEFHSEGNPIFAIIAGIALAFFAMTGFENAANVAEETIDPKRTFPKALVGGMVVAGILYVLVAMTAALIVPVGTLAGSDAALLEVVKADVLPLPLALITIVFAVIAMVAITNTCLVALVTQSRILYGMAREDVVPGVFSKVHASRRSPWVALIFAAFVVGALLIIAGQIAVGDPAPGEEKTTALEILVNVTVVFTLFIYGMVIVAALKLRGRDETEGSFKAWTPLLILGIIANAILLIYVVVDDPTSLIWCAGLLAVGGLLFLLERLFDKGNRRQAA
ncbi:APC family permease [Propionibacteriaceae bacterium Y1685]|uniref:APC family permease n=1 Tax=Microlunatus sp. Y1700 TaxID=3418487 RepID=UPI003B810648